MSKISVGCGVCGEHEVSVPARPGLYRVKCPNANKLGVSFNYSATVIQVNDDGSVKSKQGEPTGTYY